MYIFFFFSRGTQKLTHLTMKLMDTKEKKIINKVALHICFLFFTASIEQAIQKRA